MLVNLEIVNVVIIMVIIRVVLEREEQLASRLEKPNPGFNAIFQVCDRRDLGQHRYDHYDHV